MAVATLGAGCDDDSSDVATSPGPTEPATSAGTPAVPTSSTTTGPAAEGRTYEAEATTGDGHRITLEIGPPAGTGAVGECAPAPAAGTLTVPVTLTVVNQSSDRPAPFPPLRIELTAGGPPHGVLVREPSGACTFTPRLPQLGPGQPAVFRGATPTIPQGTAPGAAGQVQVSISETRFSLSAPVP